MVMHIRSVYLSYVASQVTHVMCSVLQLRSVVSDFHNFEAAEFYSCCSVKSVKIHLCVVSACTTIIIIML